jgi:hypothetical protein
MISFDDAGMVQVSELQHTLTTAWGEFGAEITVSMGGRAPETVWCGTDPLVFKGSPYHREPTDGPDQVDGWVVQVWVYAPNAPTSEWLDYPYIAKLWAAGLQEVTLPGKSFPARLSLTDTVYLQSNRFTGILPVDYAPPVPSRLGGA